MTISEPVTLLTDYLLAALVAALAIALWRSARATRQGSPRFWAAAFSASALAALAGGSWHGFHLLLPAAIAGLLWRATTGAIGLAGLLLLLGALRAAIGEPWRTRLTRVAVAKFLIYLVVVNLYDSYAVVIAEYAPNLLAVLLLSLVRFNEAAFARFSCAGILIACVAAAVQLSGLSLHAQFNHNDLYHAVQAVSFWLLYRGGLLMTDRR